MGREGHEEGIPWTTWCDDAYTRSDAGLQHFSTDDGQWADIAFPLVEDQIQSGWTRLVADLVADINGSGEDRYPTFRDGYIANQLIDQVRAAAAAANASTV